MPKIRCTGCEKVLNVPEKAQGKVIKCPTCSTKLKVPAGKSAAAPKKKRSADSGDIFGDLDDYDMEDQDSQICPYCATEMEEDEVICSGCGMNIETGQMDAKEKKKRSRKGPDPALFYTKVWGESWSFMLQEWRLALKTGLTFAFFAVTFFVCLYMVTDYVEALPPWVFWAGLTILTCLGGPGWYWLLALKIIRPVSLREKFRSDRLDADTFTSIASGIRAIFWPLILMLPIFGPLVIALIFAAGLSFSTGNPLPFVITLSVIYLPALILMPIAMVHMTARYTYKGWILWELVKIFFKNFGATIFFLIVSGVAILPVAVIALPVFVFLFRGYTPFKSDIILNLTGKATLWLMSVTELGNDVESTYYYLIKAMLNIMFASAVLTPLCILAGFSALYVMYANGLFGLYNKRMLDLVETIKEGTPATFWVRYLSHVIDAMLYPLASFLVTANDKALMLGWAVNGIGLVIFLFSKPMIPLYGVLWFFYMNWMYWAVQESSELRSTLGKDAFGLIVVSEDDKKMSMKQASVRWLLRLIMDMFPILYLTTAFHPEKRSLHDLASKTKVVWKGER